MTTDTLAPLAVNDEVELVEPVAHLKGVPVGQRGWVLVAGLPWHMVTVTFTPAYREGRMDGKCYLVRAQHLRKVPA